MLQNDETMSALSVKATSVARHCSVWTGVNMQLEMLGSYISYSRYTQTVFWPDQLIFDQTRQWGYPRVSFDVYIHNLMVVSFWGKCSENCIVGTVVILPHYITVTPDVSHEQFTE